MNNFDLVVIGGGSGGVRAARVAATRGMKVAIVEDTHWGGTCVNVGCVPKKLMVYASHFSHDFEDAREYGWQIEPGLFDWPKFMQKKDAEIRRLNGIYLNLLEKAGVTTLYGHGYIEDANSVCVGDQLIKAKRILVAVGGKPFIPDVPGAELCITSDEVFFLPQQPKSVVIVGGGFIALEFACILAGLGTRVTLLYRGALFLRGFDSDIRKRMVDVVKNAGVDLHFGVDIERIELSDRPNVRSIFISDGSELAAEQVFCATGRVPRTAKLWASKLDIETSAKGELKVNNNFQTTEPTIFGIGDVVGRLALTPVATAEAMALVSFWMDAKPVNINYSIVPSAVFTQPSLSCVGMTEDEAIAESIPVKVFETDFKHLKHTLTGRKDRIYLKMLVHKTTDKVLGVHAIGPDAGEMIQGVAVAIQAGATKADFDCTIGIHPTMAEELVTLRSERSS